MADGTPYPLPTVHLGSSAVAVVSINAALAIAPSSLNGQLSQAGSATFQYRYDWAGAVLGSISILDTVRSLQYVSSFIFPGTPQTAALPTGTNTSQMQEGMWWKYSAASSVFLAVANTTNNAAQASIVMFDNLHQPLGTRQFSLAPHASILSVLDSLTGTGPNAMVGGIEISYAGAPQSLLFSGGVEDDQAGYSASLRLAAPMPMSATNTTSAAPPAACAIASAGMMVGKPDPMEGFPPAVAFSMFGFARNTTAAPLTLHALLNYMDSSGPHNIALPDQTLQAGEARNLNLANVAQLPFQNGSVNLSFTYNGTCGSMLLGTGSVDSTGSYVFEVEPEAVGKSNGRISHFWQVGAGTDTMYTVWNPSSAAEDLIATLTYSQSSGVYRYPVHLGPNASIMISVMELIQEGVPDATGNVIPTGVQNGSLTIANSSTDLLNTVTFVMASGIYNPVAGTCCTNPVVCTGATSAEISPSTFSIPDGTTQSFQFYIVYDNGSQYNYTSEATWSGSSAYISVSTGEVAGLTPGTASFSASVGGGVPEYVACFCGQACPTGGQGASASGSVSDVTPVITGIAPSDWNAGTTTPVTFSGQYFGTNAPTLSFSPGAGISYTLSSYTDTQITANVTVAAGTPNESVSVTATSNGYNGQGFTNGGNGQSAQSSPADAAVHAPMSYSEVTVIAWVNASAITLPTGENSTLQSHLNSPATCALDMLGWFYGHTIDLLSEADNAYANAWLVKNSGNAQPPSTITPSAQLKAGNFRLYNDYGATAPATPTSQVGITPNPCGFYIPNWLNAGQSSQYNGATGTSPSGMAYQLAEGRIGSVGQNVNDTLNNTTTPWIWSAIEFNSSGTPTYSNHAVFPTYSVYINGTLTTTYNPTVSVGTFATYNASYQLTPSQIP